MHDLTPLMQACVAGDSYRIAPLVAAGAEVDRQVPNGFCALMFAAASGSVPCIAALLHGGAALETATYSGETALWFAADGGHGEAVKALLAAGAKHDVVSDKGSSPLHLCAFKEDVVGCAALLAAGAAITAPMGNGTDALMCAAQEGALGVVEVLLGGGADLSSANDNGSTALMLAAIRGHLAVVEHLLQHGADAGWVSPTGDSATYLAAQNDHLAVLRVLASAGADLEGPFRNGESCLHAVASSKLAESLPWMLEQGLDPNAARPDGVHALLLLGAVGSATSAALLIAQQAVASTPMNDGTTALHFAALRGERALAAALQNAGADPLASDDKGVTPMDNALSNGHMDLARSMGHSGELKAPATLLDGLRAAREPTVKQAAVWVEQHGATDPAVLEALIDGMKQHGLPVIDLRPIERVLLLWSHLEGERDRVLEMLGDQVFTLAKAEDFATARAWVNVLRNTATRSHVVADPETGRKRYLRHTGHCGEQAKRWFGWIDALIERGPDRPEPRYGGVTGLITSLIGLVQDADGEHRKVGPQVLQLLCRFPSATPPAGLRVGRSAPADAVIDALLPQMLGAAAAVPEAVLAGEVGYPAGNASFARTLLLLDHMMTLEQDPTPLLRDGEAIGAIALARILALYAGESSHRANTMKGNLFITALVGWLHVRTAQDPAAEPFRVMAVRFGLLDADVLAAPLVSLPEALPTTFTQLRELLASFPVELDDSLHFQRLLRSLREIVLEKPEGPELDDFHHASWVVDLQEWVEIHHEQIPEDYVVQQYWRDARPHLPVEGLIVLGRPSTTDYYFIDPRMRTAAGTVPVFLYLHEIPFGCEVVAPSLPVFLGHHLLDRWAQLNGATGEMQGLQIPKVDVVQRRSR